MAARDGGWGWERGAGGGQARVWGAGEEYEEGWVKRVFILSFQREL